MPHISLNRLFVMWADEKELAETHLRLRTSTFDWPELLKNRRIIVLAEAGSGKSDELKEQERLLSTRGDVAFYATLQDVGKKGLRAALPTTRKEQQFDAWKTSNEHAYFFIDSVDEAKADDIDFTTVLNEIAKGITGAESRATVVLSGRVSDWEYKTDMAEFKDRLPILLTPAKPELPSADEILAKVVAGNKLIEKQPQAKEEHLVVAMVALDRERIHMFAEARKVPDVEKFLTELDNANLWMLADRPLDLDWLVDYWIDHKEFQKFAKMLEYSIEHSLDELNPKRGRRSSLQLKTAVEKAERIGTGLLLGQKNEIVVPDRQGRYEPKPSDLKHDDLLKDISMPERKELIDRPLFDPATFGRLRIHNDNEGKVRSFLAAKWLLRQIKNNCDIRAVLDILFAETYGVKVIRQSMQQTAAWLSLWNDHVAKEVISRQPGLLLVAGDPASLPLATRVEALNASVALMLKLGERFGRIDEDNLRRFSTPDIETEIYRLWKLHKDNEGVRQLLLHMIWLGRLKGCADIVSEALYTKYDEYVSEVFASRALVAIGTPEEIKKYANWLTKNHEDRHHQTVWEAHTNFVPDAISISDFLKLFAALDKRGETSRYAIQTRVPDIIEKINNRADLEFIIRQGLKQVGEFPFSYQGEERPIYETYFPLISAAVQKLLKIIPRNEFSEVAAEAALFIASADRYGSNRSEAFSLQEKFDISNERRRGLFWKAYNLFNNSDFFKDKNGLQGPSQMQFMGWRSNLGLADFGWLLADAETQTQESTRKFVVMAAWSLPSVSAFIS